MPIFSPLYLPQSYQVQHRHLIPVPVYWTFANAWLYKHQLVTCQRNKRSTSVTHATFNCEFIHVSMPGNCVAIGHAVMYYDQSAWAFTVPVYWTSGNAWLYKRQLGTIYVNEIREAHQ